ncbi:HAD domain-containing protein [Paraburkholderia sp. NPDC080076]|uniref:HAD domain-containing protein n=1 Tax=Paraburkholderia sp. NPDC080076 TaxID=3390605 RepID=UPI003CFBD46C
MSERNDGAQIDPHRPAVYLGFSSVLHRGEGLLDDLGTVTLDSGEPPFHYGPLLIDVLMPYPDVQLVLTTAWVRKLGEQQTVALLPKELGNRVVDTTLRFPPRLGELRDGTARVGSIFRHAATAGMRTWLALGDDLYGVPRDAESHFLRVSTETGLATPGTLEALRAWLATNANPGRSQRPS